MREWRRRPGAPASDRCLRHQPERLNEVGRDLARRDERQGGLVELRRVRQLAVPEQVADFLEARPARQVFDVVAAVGQAAVSAVEIAELVSAATTPSSPRMS